MIGHTDGPYVPEPGEIAGFDLTARLQPDGTLVTEAGTVFTEFPPEVEVCGVTYTLEYVKPNEVPVGHPSGDPTIQWGIYV